MDIVNRKSRLRVGRPTARFSSPGDGGASNANVRRKCGPRGFRARSDTGKGQLVGRLLPLLTVDLLNRSATRSCGFERHSAVSGSVSIVINFRPPPLPVFSFFAGTSKFLVRRGDIFLHRNELSVSVSPLGAELLFRTDGPMAPMRSAPDSTLARSARMSEHADERSGRFELGSKRGDPWMRRSLGA